MEYSVERVHSSTKAYGSGFMMLNCNLYSIFTQYLIGGRVRAPPASALVELSPTFQDGARTDRRALQSKFKSWAKRMTLVDGKLVMATSGKLIIPSECCAMVIKELHFRNPESHLTIDEVVSEIQKTYTWNRKNFGMDWNIVATTLKDICKLENCLGNLHSRLFKPSAILSTKEISKLPVQSLLPTKRMYFSGDCNTYRPKNSLVPFPFDDISHLVPYRRLKIGKSGKPKKISTDNTQPGSPTLQKKMDFLKTLGLKDLKSTNKYFGGTGENKMDREVLSQDKSASAVSVTNTTLISKSPKVNIEHPETDKGEKKNDENFQIRKDAICKNLFNSIASYATPVKIETTKMIHSSLDKSFEEETKSENNYEKPEELERTPNNDKASIEDWMITKAMSASGIYEKILCGDNSTIGSTPNMEVENKLQDLYKIAVQKRAREQERGTQQIYIRSSQKRMFPILKPEHCLKTEGESENVYILPDLPKELYTLIKSEASDINGPSAVTSKTMPNYFIVTPTTTTISTTTMKQETPCSAKSEIKPVSLKRRIMAAYERDRTSSNETNSPQQKDQAPLEKRMKIWRPDPESMGNRKLKEPNTNKAFTTMPDYAFHTMRIVSAACVPPDTKTMPKLLPRPLASKPTHFKLEDAAKAIKQQGKKREKQEFNIFREKDNIYERMETIRRFVNRMNPYIKLTMAGSGQFTDILENQIEIAQRLIQETKVYLREVEQ